MGTFKTIRIKCQREKSALSRDPSSTGRNASTARMISCSIWRKNSVPPAQKVRGITLKLTDACQPNFSPIPENWTMSFYPMARRRKKWQISWNPKRTKTKGMNTALRGGHSQLKDSNASTAPKSSTSFWSQKAVEPALLASSTIPTLSSAPKPL